MTDPAPETVDTVEEPVVVELGYRSPGAFLVAYATNLARGGLFIETPTPLIVGTPLTLRLRTPPDVEVIVAGKVAWSRGLAEGPGQPAGMGVALATSTGAIGAVVDRLAFGFSGIQVLLGATDAAPRAMLSRYLRSIVTCQILELDDAGNPTADLAGVDLAVVDLDASGATGAGVYQRLRTHPRAATAPVIALAQLERDRARALRMGFDEVIANPPSFPDLRAAVLCSLAKPIVVR